MPPRFRGYSLRIETYFQQVRETIDACPVVQSSNVTYDKRSSFTGFIRGEIYLIDDSVFHLREFLDVETDVERLTYAYQYMDAAQELIFRYDNSGHHKRLNLPTWPHHKHDGSTGAVVAASAPDLAAILQEIESFIQLP
jgi:hypothetical protein